MIIRITYFRGAVFLFLLLALQVNARADIFISETAENGTRYASQALDSTFRLLSHGDQYEKAPAMVIHSAKGKPSAGRMALSNLIEQLAKKHAIEPAIIDAIADIESGGNIHAVSPVGARGAMQLMPATAARYGVIDPFNPAQNIEAGILHIKYLLALHHGNLALALAAYNAGEGAVARHAGRIPPFKETMLYVPAVLARLQKHRSTSLP